MKRYYFLMIALLAIGAAKAQDWKIINDHPLYSHYTCVDFSDENTGYAAGYNGTILKTTDGGITWKVLTPGTMRTIIDLHCISSNKVLALIATGILKTDDGGETWQSVTLTNNFSIQSMCVKDVNTIFVLKSNGEIFKSTDGGDTWNLLSTAPARDVIHFVDDNIGFVANSYSPWDTGHIWKTGDAGTTWTIVESSDGLDVRSFYFTDNNTGYAASYDGKILKTIDAGQSWNTIVDSNRYLFVDVEFITPQHGYFIDESCGVVETLDAGLTWNEIEYFPFKLSGASFPSSNTGYLVSPDGLVLKTIDSGSNWTQLNDEILATNIKFFGNTGFLLTERSIYKTIDGAATWNEIYYDSLVDPISFFFVNNNVGYFSCYDLSSQLKKVYKTNDGGISWASVLEDSSFINQIKFIDIMNGYVSGRTSGEEAFIWNTNDAGITWEKKTVCSPCNITALDFYTPLIGFAATSWNNLTPNVIRRTTDGGESWSTVYTLSGMDYITSLGILNYPNCIATADNGTILFSDNGGNSWVSVYTDTTLYLSGLGFYNSSTAYVMGSKMYSTGEDVLLKSSDGGLTWIQQELGTYFGPFAMTFADNQVGYMLAYPGVIYKTENASEIITGDVENNGVLLFPNPANEIITIKLNEMNQEDVFIRIFNTLGDEVTNMKVEKGVRSATIDIAALQSGIYYFSFSGYSGKFIKQ